MDNFAPCRLVRHEMSFSLIFSDFGVRMEFLQERGLEGGGYTWHALAESLMRLRQPALYPDVKYDPEGSMSAAYGQNVAALEALAVLIRQVQTDDALLEEAIANVNPDLLD